MSILECVRELTGLRKLALHGMTVADADLKKQLAVASTDLQTVWNRQGNGRRLPRITPFGIGTERAKWLDFEYRCGLE